MAQKSKTVVVADDEPLIRAVAMDALADCGFTVIEASGADEVLGLLQSHAPEIDMLFTDIHMPGCMDGLALAQLASRHWPWIAVLVASGEARPASGQIPAGGRLLAKPYGLDQVLTHVHELLRSK
jgi:CheY-like chemotaxis protein